MVFGELPSLWVTQKRRSEKRAACGRGAQVLYEKLYCSRGRTSERLFDSHGNDSEVAGGEAGPDKAPAVRVRRVSLSFSSTWKKPFARILADPRADPAAGPDAARRQPFLLKAESPAARQAVLVAPAAGRRSANESSGLGIVGLRRSLSFMSATDGPVGEKNSARESRCAARTYARTREISQIYPCRRPNARDAPFAHGRTTRRVRARRCRPSAPTGGFETRQATCISRETYPNPKTAPIPARRNPDPALSPPAAPSRPRR